jgi:hypothetical protein
LLVLLSDAGATLDGEVDGEALVCPRVDGEVRSLQGIHRSGSSTAIDLHASKGAIVALWLAPPAPPPAPADLIEKPGWRK